MSLISLPENAAEEFRIAVLGLRDPYQFTSPVLDGPCNYSFADVSRVQDFWQAAIMEFVQKEIPHPRVVSEGFLDMSRFPEGLPRNPLDRFEDDHFRFLLFAAGAQCRLVGAAIRCINLGECGLDSAEPLQQAHSFFPYLERVIVAGNPRLGATVSVRGLDVSYTYEGWPYRGFGRGVKMGSFRPRVEPPQWEFMPRRLTLDDFPALAVNIETSIMGAFMVAFFERLWCSMEAVEPLYNDTASFSILVDIAGEGSDVAELRPFDTNRFRDEPRLPRSRDDRPLALPPALTAPEIVRRRRAAFGAGFYGNPTAISHYQVRADLCAVEIRGAFQLRDSEGPVLGFVESMVLGNTGERIVIVTDHIFVHQARLG